MRTICFVSPPTRIGGGEVSLLTLLRHLDRNSYTPIAVCYGPGEVADRLRVLGIQTHVVPRGGLLTSLLLILRLADLFRRQNVHLVHINTLDIRAGLAAWLAGRPFIGHLRVVFPFTWVDRLFVRLASKVISVSNAVRDIFCANHRRLADRFTTIYNAVSVTQVPCGGDIRAELGLPSSAPLVGAVARIDAWKGLHVFLRVAAQIGRTRPGTKFLIVGRSDPGDPESISYERELHRSAADLGLADDLHFLGFREDAPDIIRQLTVLVVPSLVLKTDRGLKAEGFGRVIVEAMALGTAVVGTATGGIPEIITDGDSGLLVPPGKVGETAGAVGRLLESEPLRNRLTDGGKRRFLDRFTAGRHASEVQALFEAYVHHNG